jgi:3-hydroxybutyryl-CoA dehydratase
MTGAATETKRRLSIGDEMRAPPRSMHRERMRWYVDGLFTARANDGKVHTEENIHTDDEYARSQGLPGIIADGMISTNWIFGFLLDTFGSAYLEKGSLRTKYVRPILEDQLVVVGLRVRQIERTENELRYELDVWCEEQSGQMLTVGSAEVYVPE